MLKKYVIIKTQSTKPKPKPKEIDIMMITRISKDNYKVTCGRDEFTVIKRCFSDHWYVECKSLQVSRLCDSLSEALDYIDYIML